MAIRASAVAGMFYPANPHVLRETVSAYLQAASPPALESVRAVVVPHAGYVYSGAVAATAYRLLADQAPPRRCYLLGPSHRAWFPGVALANYDAFRTPLGNVPLDREAFEALRKESLFTPLNVPHGPEHCLEVQLPFLQMIYSELKIIPMLFGEVDPIAVGKVLSAYLTDEDLVIVSSDLSHYHDNETAHRLDRQFLEALLREDVAGIAAGEACGQAPALALTEIARSRGWQPHLLDYRTSGDITGERRQVVGYAAVAYVSGGAHVDGK